MACLQEGSMWLIWVDIEIRWLEAPLRSCDKSIFCRLISLDERLSGVPIRAYFVGLLGRR